MRFIRHILSYLYLIFILAVLVLAFYFRPLLLPQDINSRIEGWVGAVYPPALEFVIKQKVEQEKVAEISKPVMPAPVKAVEEPTVDAEPIVEPQETPVQQVSEQQSVEDVPQQEIPEVVQTDASVIEQTEIAEAQMKEVEAETVEAAPQEAPASDRDAAAEQQLLADARRAYISRDYEAAVKNYQELITLDENNPDIFGEMGNVYYTQGKWQEAGAAYYEAAIRLIETDQLQQVPYLIRVIQGLDQEAANRLAERLNRNR